MRSREEIASQRVVDAIKAVGRWRGPSAGRPQAVLQAVDAFEVAALNLAVLLARIRNGVALEPPEVKP